MALLLSVVELALFLSPGDTACQSLGLLPVGFPLSLELDSLKHHSVERNWPEVESLVQVIESLDQVEKIIYEIDR